MSRILCVANWSEGRKETVLQTLRSRLHDANVDVHYDGADFDHNRLVTAFSGSLEEVRSTLMSLCDAAFASIDMRSHRGVHPRIGALDVCPFIVLGGSVSEQDAIAFVREVGEEIASRYELPIFFYEKSETGKHAADLPSLRSGQYEGLFARTLQPDAGPTAANPRLGAAVIGVRDWLLAANIDLDAPVKTAREIAREMRKNRDAGDTKFAGVRALGFELASRGLSQLSMNLTKPDETSFDAIYEWVEQRDVAIVSTELIGVIRPSDLPKSSRLTPMPQQVVDP